MATAKSKVTAPTDEELSQMLEKLEEDTVPAPLGKGIINAKGSKAPIQQAEQDILAELENLGAELPPSRPHTPRVKLSIKHGATTPIASSRTSEEKASVPRRSEDSNRPINIGIIKPERKIESPNSEKKSTNQNSNSNSTVSSGWWGSVFATATAAVKTAEAAMKEIQHNEEAKRWADQVKGNVGALRDIGGQISSRALPTFTNILHTLAPPISSHERLQIHITHDFINYPPLDPLIYSTFSRVMEQVEGGDLLVVQRGHESSFRRTSEIGYTGGSNSWKSGPWWRENSKRRDIGAVKGLVEGTKLVRVSAETYANEYFNSHGGLEKAIQRATQDISESNPVRSSDIFLAVQAIAYDAPVNQFQGSAQIEEECGIVTEKDCCDELILFAIYLHDPVHNITFKTLSQSLPAQWIRWLETISRKLNVSDTSSPPNLKSSFFKKEPEESQDDLPEEIADVIQSGGVDPREWVSEWIEETLCLSTGILAQRYVARRMGVREEDASKAQAKMKQVLRDDDKEASKAS
ncbi:Maintenance of telomere capping protein 1 [Erysiphe neolycopersici]|uniref:Maintenance of telomere capping protein 1 n=1 Tax=Erysiphe neolycopersici TaxID=212602 RepID=A0A420HJZ7_9PEZI|nr:Maintenance of telomere capping protein 1 [Erysiphe neolycopersici]